MQIVGWSGLLSFLAIVASNGNRRIERGGYIALMVILILGGGVLGQAEMSPLSQWV